MTETAEGISPDALTAVMTLSLDAVVTKTRQGVITGWNKYAAEMYGYRAEEIIGRDARVLLPPGWESEEADLLRRVGAGERIVPYTTNRVRKDGTVITVLISMAATADAAGDIDGVFTTSRLLIGPSAPADSQVPREDRERLRTQLEQAQRLEGLGQLAGGVAHDFNNLLGVILNYAAFVGEEIDLAAAAQGDGPRWKSAADDVGQIRRAAERAAGLTRQLLSFARREVVQPQVVDLSDLLHAMTGSLRRTLGPELELVTRLARDLPPVLVDPGQFDQVILNLAVNARDAMPEGGRLTVTTDSLTVDRAYAAEWSSVLPGGYVRVTITDTGSGMPPEVLKHAFEPFFTTKSKGEGSGLGLATVYGAVAQAEGHVRVTSAPGEGTTFTILLPITARSAAEAARTPPSRGLASGQTILVIDDEEALLQVTCRLLKRQGYTVIAAASGAAALAKASTYPGEIDLLLTDVIMPQMFGKEAAERIRESRPDIRVIYMSGYARPVLASQGRLDPNVELLDKPFTERELLDKVHSVLAPEPAARIA